MTALSPAEVAAAQKLIDLALAEDRDTAGDVTSLATIPADLDGRGVFIVRAPGVVAGLRVAGIVCKTVDPTLRLEALYPAGKRLERGDRMGVIAGPVRSILAAERTALNFLQRLSGVATLTRKFVDAAARGGPAQVFDTRKTTPGWRLLEKYAVRMGGGHNHRLGLSDAYLIKDNHVAALGGGPDAVRKAIEAARAGPKLQIEVEVVTLEELDAALACHPDIVLLDNMQVEVMRQCVERRNRTAPRVKLEASGGVNLATIEAIAATGVDRISVGALTHSAVALDISLEIWATAPEPSGSN